MYKILLLPKAQKDLDRLEGKVFDQILEKLHQLEENPRPPGSLKLTAEEGHRLRSGDYRILYRINDKESAVYIYRIKPRKDIYK